MKATIHTGISLRLYLGSDSLQLFNAIWYIRRVLVYIIVVVVVVVVFMFIQHMNLFRVPVLSTLQPTGNSSVAQVT